MEHPVAALSPFRPFQFMLGLVDTSSQEPAVLIAPSLKFSDSLLVA